MKTKKIAMNLSELDREFILKFFNMSLQFKKPNNEFNIDAHLSKNFTLFFTFCDYLYANKDNYVNLKHKFNTEK